MGGRHRITDHRTRTVELVDARTGEAHLLTPQALAAARRKSKGRYVAVCGADVVPTIVNARGRDYCRSCTSIPTQRTEGPR